jgi:xanthine phosphoribosyltransferase
MGLDERYHKTFPITWEQLHRDCRALAWRLADLRSWKKIIAIARGGLIPAAIIARELDVRYMDTVCVSSYNLREQGELQILKQVEAFEEESSEEILLIDDLVDTGKTASLVRKMFPGAYFATVYAKPDGRPLVDSFITEVSQDTWILCPWDAETKVHFVLPIAESRRDLERP